MEQLLRGRHFHVDVDAETRLVRATRTALPFASVDEMQRAHKELLRAVARLADHALLLDVRLAPARSDPEYETGLASLRRQITERFPRVAVLVKSAVGGLHARRLARADGVTMRIFQDEAAALEYLERPT